MEVRPRAAFWLSLAGGITALATGAAYLLLLTDSGGLPDTTHRTSFVSAFILTLGALVTVSGLSPLELPRAFALGMGTAGLGLLGVLGMGSIGFLLLAAAMVIGWALILIKTNSAGPKVAVIAGLGAMLAVAAVGVGFYATELPTACPGITNGGGGGDTWFHGTYSYTCDHGRFTLSTR